MHRQILSALVLLGLAMLTACASMAPISSADVAGTPTTYAKVVKPPNSLLLGHYRRSAPVGINKPWAFNYWLIKKGDKYAVYYYFDSHKKNSFKGWADFTINGDTITSGVDGVTFFVKDGGVEMGYPGRKETYHMMKVE